MNNLEEAKVLIPKQPETRKRKILTDPNGLWAKCKTCREPGNLENLIRQGIPAKNSQGVELYGGFRYVYFCSESCRGLFKG